MSRDGPPELSAVLVTWNAAGFVASSLASVAADLGAWRHEIIVVDNASSDDTLAVVRHTAPAARVLACAANRGFAAAANDGLRAARAPFVLFLNPDAEPLPGAVGSLMAALHAAPRLALVGPQLLDPDGGLQVSHAAFRWPLERLWAHVGGSAEHAAGTRQHGAPCAPAVQSVDWLIGACMLGRRAALLEVGGFDEGYFMYAEDMDLCYRLRARGHEIGFCPESKVRHLGNASGARLWRERREAAVIRSQLRFLRLHRGLASDLGYRALALPFYLVRMAVLQLRAAVAPATHAAEHHAAARRCFYSLQVLAGGGGSLPPGSR